MLKSSETVNVLLRTKERIRTPRMWSRGEGRKHGGRVCMMVALNQIDNCSTAAWEAVRDAIIRLYPKRVDGMQGQSLVVEFNDHPDTTHADVVRVFDEAIYTAE